MPGRTEFNLTGFLDGLFEPMSRNTGVPAEDYSAITGGMLFGTLEDAVLDILLKPFPSAIVQTVTGLGMALYSAFAEGVDPRLRKELWTWGIRNATEIFDPANFMAAKSSAEEIFEKIQNKASVDEIIGAIFRTPDELAKMFGLEQKKPPVQKEKQEQTQKKKVVVEVPIQNTEPVEENEEDEAEKWRKLSA